MNNKDYVPGKDDDFARFSKKMKDYATSRREGWGIPDPRWTEFVNDDTTFQAKYLLTTDVATKTPKAVAEKNDARNKLEHVIRKLVKEYMANNSLLTVGDREELGLPIYSNTRSHHGVPTEEAHIEHRVLDERQIEITVVNFHGGHGRQTHKPTDADRVRIVYGIADKELTHVTELTTDAIVSAKTTHVVNFTHEDQHKSAFFAARYENTRGEGGNWSPIQKIQIP